MNSNKVIISGINIFEGGALSLLKDCLEYLNSSEFTINYNIVVLVHKKKLFDKLRYKNLSFVEFPKSRNSYLHRLYYEYFYFKKFAIENKVVFWLSLHDITPNLVNISQAVYCHNPSPFNTFNFKDLFIQPTQFFFKLFYKYLYQINIKKNKYVIVQQFWIKDKFCKMFSINDKTIIVAKPQVPTIMAEYLQLSPNNLNKKFFFPTFPRPFKNIEIICEAAKILIEKNIINFKVLITISGVENQYAKTIYNKFKDVNNILFIGLQQREAIYKLYAECDCMIFPSKLETWGLPISEFKQYNKPMFVANLPYAKETVGEYNKVIFFEPSNAIQLATNMENLILGNKSNFDVTTPQTYTEPYANNWYELFNTLLKQ